MTYANGGFIPPASTTIHVPPKFTPTPTPIDPADIRPGDVVERRRLYIVEGRGPDHSIDARCNDTNAHEMLNPAVGTWYLIHRPDPDAEAVEDRERAQVASEWLAALLAEVRADELEIVAAEFESSADRVVKANGETERTRYAHEVVEVLRERAKEVRR